MSVFDMSIINILIVDILPIRFFLFNKYLAIFVFLLLKIINLLITTFCFFT